MCAVFIILFFFFRLLLSIIDEQAYWSLLRIFFDRSREGVKQFFVARELIEQQIDLAEKSFGETDERSIPWSYRKAVNNLRLVQLLNVSNGLSYETIDRLFREDGALALQDRDAPFFYGRQRGSITPTVKQGSMLGQRYLEKSYRLVKDIDEILEQKAAMLKAAESPKYLQALETQAMAKIARGDFQQLLGRSTAIRDYREAKELLVDAGVEKKLIEHLNSSIIITRGENGVSIFDKSSPENTIHLPTNSQEVMDVSGAGDTLLSIMAAGMSKNKCIMSVAALACCAASIAVDTMGNKPVEIERVLDKAIKIINKK